MGISNFWLAVPNSGRSISENAWQTIEPAHINVWRSAVTLLGERRVVHRETNYAVSIDWRPALRRHERTYSAMRYVERNVRRELNSRFARANFPLRPSRNKVSVAPENDRIDSSSIVASAIHDIFLIMNIAAPGCCDFYKASLVGARFEQDVSLANVHFEAALQLYLDNGWPTSRVLELDRVISWFETIRQGPSQIPQNPMERVLGTSKNSSRQVATNLTR